MTKFPWFDGLEWAEMPRRPDPVGDYMRIHNVTFPDAVEAVALLHYGKKIVRRLQEKKRHDG
jgi:hypothetical protein